MRNDYIQYLSDLKINEVDNLLQKFLGQEIDRQKFDAEISEWAFTEQNFVNLIKNG